MDSITDKIVDKLEKDRPLFHEDGKGGLITWHSNTNLLRILEGYLAPGMQTLETGAGYSTVIFISKRCLHTAITPRQAEIDRIKAYCMENSLSLDHAEFIAKDSADHLPLIQNRELDLFFIDGAHRFPFPVVDFFYGSRLLKQGGLLIVDDTDIISCFLLKKFLESDAHWERFLQEDTFAVFKKLGGLDYPGSWTEQNFSRNKIDGEKTFINIFFSQSGQVKNKSNGDNPAGMTGTLVPSEERTGASAFPPANGLSNGGLNAESEGRPVSVFQKVRNITAPEQSKNEMETIIQASSHHLVDRPLPSSNGLSSSHAGVWKNKLQLSVILCTYNRANLLKMALESLITQTLDRSHFEVIVIDDGSSDGTRQIVDSFVGKLPIKYFYQKNAGLAAAKNHGIYVSQGEILFFFDDDDMATPTLLEEHIKTHQKHPQEHYAVLNYTTWAPNLLITPLMHFITDVGCFLFFYPNLKHGEILDYTYFWGGRSSCKRSFLINFGVFNPAIRIFCEDIELGYRLSKFNLQVVYNSHAISHMVRPVTFDEFCQRLIKHGRSQYVFSKLHDNPEVHKYTEVLNAEIMWNKISPVYEAKVRSARELDKIVNLKLRHGLDIDNTTMMLLHRSYLWAFRASKIKGIMMISEEESQNR